MRVGVVAGGICIMSDSKNERCVRASIYLLVDDLSIV